MPDIDNLLDLSSFDTDALYDWRAELLETALEGRPEQTVINDIDDELSARGLPEVDPALEVQF